MVCSYSLREGRCVWGCRGKQLIVIPWEDRVWAGKLREGKELERLRGKTARYRIGQSMDADEKAPELKPGAEGEPGFHY